MIGDLKTKDQNKLVTNSHSCVALRPQHPDVMDKESRGAGIGRC
jgi:hypothetical protein